MSIRLAIVGIAGRMGTEVHLHAGEFGFQVTQGVTKDSKQFTSRDATSPIIVENMTELKPNDVDLVIDFSLPDFTEKVLSWCVANKKTLVSGTTGLSKTQIEKVRAAGKEIAVLWSPNMSLGIAVVGRMLEAFSNLNEFDFQIEELHHNRKIDRPSGTALFLQQKLEGVLSKSLVEPVSIRGGGIFGIHKVWAMSEEEVITVEHTAMNRQVFAKGALKAARWLVQQSPGFYSLDDMLFGRNNSKIDE